MQNINDMSVKEALERLSLPSFFDDDQRMAAYYVVMEMGNPIQKVMAEKVIGQYPLEEFFALNAEAA
jgi:hypothetical protein